MLKSAVNFLLLFPLSVTNCENRTQENMGIIYSTRYAPNTGKCLYLILLNQAHVAAWKTVATFVTTCRGQHNSGYQWNLRWSGSRTILYSLWVSVFFASKLHVCVSACGLAHLCRPSVWFMSASRSLRGPLGFPGCAALKWGCSCLINKRSEQVLEPADSSVQHPCSLILWLYPGVEP